MPGESHSWIQLASGAPLEIDQPYTGALSIQDIAASLSRLCRFNGHLRDDVAFYSVAQHSVLVSRLVPERLALVGLLHDATEAVLGDVTGPLKRLLPDYRKIEKLWAFAIGNTFGLGDQLENLPPEVKHADEVMLSTERLHLLADSRRPWRSLPEPAPFFITPMPPREARKLFLLRYEELRGRF